MQVDRVQSPSFGALIIRKEALPALKKASPEVIKMIDRVGEDLKEFSFPTLRLVKNLKPRIFWNGCGTIQGGPFTPIKPNDEDIFYRTCTNVDSLGYCASEKMVQFNILRGFALDTYQQAEDAYKRMKNFSLIERAAELAKISNGIFDGRTNVTTDKFISNAEELYEKYKSMGKDSFEYCINKPKSKSKVRKLLDRILSIFPGPELDNPLDVAGSGAFI